MSRAAHLTAACALALGLAGPALTRPAAPNLVGVARAVGAAEAALDAKAFEAELDRERGALVYEVRLVKEGRALEAEVDAVTGELTRRRGPLGLRMPWGGSDLRAAQTAPRTLSQAIAAIEAATKGKVREIGLEQLGGRHYYEVELVGAEDREVRVDLRTGAITPVIDD